MDFGVGKNGLHCGVELFRLEVAGGFDHLMFGDEFDFRPHFRAEKHLVAAGGEESRNATADHADSHAVEHVDRAGYADRLFESGVRFRGTDFGVNMEIRNMHPVHEMGIHVRGAERVVLEASALRIRLLHRPEHDGNFETLREHRDDHAERKCHEVGDDQVRAFLFEEIEFLNRLVLEIDHAVAADHFDSRQTLKIFLRVFARGFKSLVRPVCLRQRKIADLECLCHCCSSCEYQLFFRNSSTVLRSGSPARPPSLRHLSPATAEPKRMDS